MDGVCLPASGDT